MKVIRRLLFFVLCMLIWGCEAQKSQAGDKTAVLIDIDSNKAQELINENNVIIIDVRTPQEYNIGHINNAKNINISDKSFQSRIENLDKNANYLVYCRTGNRSRHAVNMMEKMDFKTIYHLEHGITEWIREGKPVVK